MGCARNDSISPAPLDTCLASKSVNNAACTHSSPASIVPKVRSSANHAGGMKQARINTQRMFRHTIYNYLMHDNPSGAGLQYQNGARITVIPEGAGYSITIRGGSMNCGPDLQATLYAPSRLCCVGGENHRPQQCRPGLDLHNTRCFDQAI